MKVWELLILNWEWFKPDIAHATCLCSYAALCWNDPTLSDERPTSVPCLFARLRRRAPAHKRKVCTSIEHKCSAHYCESVDRCWWSWHVACPESQSIYARIYCTSVVWIPRDMHIAKLPKPNTFENLTRFYQVHIYAFTKTIRQSRVDLTPWCVNGLTFKPHAVDSGTTLLPLGPRSLTDAYYHFTTAHAIPSGLRPWANNALNIVVTTVHVALLKRPVRVTTDYTISITSDILDGCVMLTHWNMCHNVHCCHVAIWCVYKPILAYHTYDSIVTHSTCVDLHCRMILSLRIRNVTFICSNSWWFAAFSFIKRRTCALTLCIKKKNVTNKTVISLMSQTTQTFTLWKRSFVHIDLRSFKYRANHLNLQNCWNCISYICACVRTCTML